jgi:hypothetical protein
MLDLDKPFQSKFTPVQEASVKTKVQQKLEEYLDATADTVLCDYVLVMIGNKKTAEQIQAELEVRMLSGIVSFSFWIPLFFGRPTMLCHGCAKNTLECTKEFCSLA